MPPHEPLTPRWPAPAAVRAAQTLRDGPLPSLPAAPCWLTQVHGAAVVRAAAGVSGVTGDAAVATDPGVVLAIRTADCLPVLFCTADGTRVGAAHAGWRGLAAGVLEATVAAMEVAPASLLAWLGPAIGQPAFEVGPEVRDALLAGDPGASTAFRRGRGDRWHADLEALARRRLARAGLGRASGGGWCTYADPQRFHSYRRDRETGRMVSLIWLGDGLCS